MVATRGRTFKRPWRRSYHSSKLKSSSAPTGRKDSWCFHAVGSSNAPLLGSTAAEGLPRIGRTSIATRWRSCGSPQSASCSENFVIPPDVFGQTLSSDRCKSQHYLMRCPFLGVPVVHWPAPVGAWPLYDPLLKGRAFPSDDWPRPTARERSDIIGAIARKPRRAAEPRRLRSHRQARGDLGPTVRPPD